MPIAIKDVIQGFKNYDFWVTFGANEIKKKYRRSKLGQLWITLSVAIFVFAIGNLYKSLFNIEGDFYMTYLAVGYILWLFISGVITRSGTVFTKNRSFLLQRDWPATTFVLWLVYSQILTLAHNSIILIPIFIFWGTWPDVTGFFVALAGFGVTFLTALSVAMIIGITALRYRDLEPILKSLIRLAFFATPIIWIERDLGPTGNLITMLNPFGYFLRIVRDPILGFPINPVDWVVAGSVLTLCTLGALLLLSRTKHRLAFWL